MSNSASKQQTTFFKGIYEFEDVSNCLLAAKTPAQGTVDLYAGTAVIVKPNQLAIFIYKGKIADVIGPGTYEIKTENVPVLTKLANWEFGFQSPLRCELYFISSHVFTSRRWGSPQPILCHFKDIGPAPIRTYGHFNFKINNAQIFFEKLVGTKSSYSVSDVEEFIQGEIINQLPNALNVSPRIENLSQNNKLIAQELENKINQTLVNFGLQLENIQILSLLPTQEILEAIESKVAINIIGSSNEYLIYKAASQLNQAGQSEKSADPLQVMLGLLLTKGIAPLHNKQSPSLTSNSSVNSSITILCSKCKSQINRSSQFCSQCGEKI